MPFGKHLYAKSAGYGVFLAELIPAELPDREDVSDHEMDVTVRSLLAASAQGEMQAFTRCQPGRRRWVAAFSDGHPTGPLEASHLDPDDLRDMRLAAASDPVIESRLRMVEDFLSGAR